MRSLFRFPTLALDVLVAAGALLALAAGTASAGPAAPATSVDSAASEPESYVHLNLRFDRVMAKLDREVTLQLLPTTMDCSNGADASGADVCVVRLSPAFPAAVPASPAHP